MNSDFAISKDVSASGCVVTGDGMDTEDEGLEMESESSGICRHPVSETDRMENRRIPLFAIRLMLAISIPSRRFVKVICRV